MDNKNGQLIRSAFDGYVGKMTINYLFTFLGSIVDGVVISRFLGLESMAAFQLTLPVVLMDIMLSMIFSVGLQNCCAKSLGAGRLHDATAYYSVTLAVIVPLALLWGLAVWFLAEPLARLLGASGGQAHLLPLAAAYLRGLAPSLTVIMIMPMMSMLLFLEGKAKYAMAAISCQVSINVVGDFANVLFLHWGMLGMGMTTSLCNIIALAIIIVTRCRFPFSIRFVSSSIRLRQLLQVARIGLPTTLDRLYKTLQVFLVNHVLLAVATGTALAAYADINALYNLFIPFVIGISSSCLSVAGVFFGERDRASLDILLRHAVIRALKVSTLIALICAVGAPWLIMLFASPSDMGYSTAVHALRIYAWFYPLYALNKVLQSFYIGCNAVRMAYFVSTLENLLFITLSVVVLGRWLGADGVWFGFVVGEALTLICTALAVGRAKRHMPRSINDYIYLPEYFDEAAKSTFSQSATTMDEVLEISRSAQQFMLEHGADKLHAMLVSLSIEEMGGNIIRWGFTDGKRHHIDIRLVCSRGWTLRIRDDCARFDPVKWLKLHNDEDKTRNIGIRTVCALASDVRYTSPLGLNYLFITWNDNIEDKH